ncbi:MAG TPA: hypothetical protein VKF62_05045, partial [Planctomycetota bacterium]|nr:hypothetical protein [Planctomycetota bacterium]
LAVGLVQGCVAVPQFQDPGLERALYPGLVELTQPEIEAALDKEVSIRPPLAAGVAWLGGASPDFHSEYHRTGVLEAAVAALRQEPFGMVTSIPTIPMPVSVDRRGQERPFPPTLDALRGACARFQCDVALLMQTGVARDSGPNVLAIAYLPLVTIPLVPGTDLAASASVEMCAIDVRTGVLLGCARGRCAKTKRFVFPTSTAEAEGRLSEEALREAVVAAAGDLRAQLSQRLVVSAERSGGPRERPAK